MTDLDEYAERLYVQAITSPQVNSLNTQEMRTYIEEQAEMLCLPPEEVSEQAMKAHTPVTTADFKIAKEYRQV